MLKRYPHSAELILQVGTSPVSAPDDGIIGRETGNDVVYPIQGRFEDASGHGGGYTAKFYARVSSLYSYIGNDGAKLVFAGRSFDVVRLVPFQTHTEIWLS